MPILQDSLQNAQAGVPAPAATAATAPQNIPGAPAAGQGQQLPPPNPETTSPLVKAHEDELANMVKVMPPEMRDAYQRVVVAGKKMMYAPETAEAIHGIVLDDKIPMANKLGEGVANLVVMMDNQGNGTIPKDVLIPVGVTLMFEAADYLFEVGMEVTEKDLSDGMEMMVYSIFDAYGVPQEEVDKVIDKLMGDLDLDDETKEKLAGGVKEREAEDMEAAEAETPEQETAEGPAGEEAEFNAGFDAEQAKRRM
jgi:hypothetical protein